MNSVTFSAGGGRGLFTVTGTTMHPITLPLSLLLLRRLSVTGATVNTITLSPLLGLLGGVTITGTAVNSVTLIVL